MNFGEKINNHHHEDEIMMSTSGASHKYYYAEGSSRSTPPELDLMDATPLHSHHEPENNNNNTREYSGTSAAVVVEREHMFDKVVTPSDVGKLNRLVIPKQHAEKYFPLDSTSNDNKQGLLLNFEDSNGKSWRFRYSYWNSSQSYVMTKGWSRFVKDKKLDAGDIVSFHRGLGHQAKDRLFIHWRRRPPPPPDHHHIPFSTHHNFSLLHTPQYPHQYNRSGLGSVPLGSGYYLPSHPLRSGGDHYGHNNVVYGYGGTNNASASHHDDLLNNNSRGNSLIYFRSSGEGATVNAPPTQYRHQQQASLEGERMRFSSISSGEFQRGGVEQVFESVPVVQGKAAAKRLRLFGVNMDCPIPNEDEDEDEEEEHVSLRASHHAPTAKRIPWGLQSKMFFGSCRKNENDVIRLINNRLALIFAVLTSEMEWFRRFIKAN